MKILLLYPAMLFSITTFAQVGINATDPKTTLDVTGKPTDATAVDGVIAPKELLQHN